MSEEVSIRVAVEGDLPRLIDLDHVARRPDDTRRRFLAEHVAERRTLVAEQGERIVGYAVQDRSFFERGFVHLLYVGEHDRRQGLGTALLDAAVAACGTGRVFTSTNLSNAPMQSLLTKVGWTQAGMVDGLDDGDPEVFFYVDAR